MHDRPDLLRPRCPRCGSVWAGTDRAHCPSCCQTFDDPALFDDHRESGACTDGRSLSLVQTKNGIWVRPFQSSC
ncbi:MAG: hypothetical protein EKK42_08310 [Pseudonocardiaceae bacterium]|nr:MAG: hypothetical protein EKK42_08310 [Pseudonocardiaceae bacterium]